MTNIVIVLPGSFFQWRMPENFPGFPAPKEFAEKEEEDFTGEL
jgi:hypothetical protein